MLYNLRYKRKFVSIMNIYKYTLIDDSNSALPFTKMENIMRCLVMCDA